MRVLLVVYDNAAHLHTFPTGLAYVASVLRLAGHSVEIYHQNLHHFPPEHLTQTLDATRYDAVGVGVIGGYYQYQKLLEIAESVNRSRQRPFFFLGGHGPSPEPEYFLRKTQADAAVVGEGEDTVVELLAAVAARRGLDRVKGIAYASDGNIRINPRRELIENPDSIPFPAYEMFPMEYYRLLRQPRCQATDFVMTMISGRGCRFKCAFCYRLDPGFRPRSAESIIEELRLLMTDYQINYVYFNDELFMSSPRRTTELCEAFIRAGLKFRWACQGRLNFAKPKLLALMRRAGCVFVNYGIEALDDGVLKKMNKALTVKQIISGIEATLASGVSPGFNIIFGNVGDNRETLRKGVEFLIKYDDGAQMRTIRPVTPYPGSPLYYRALREGLLKDCQDFYENKHVNSDLLAVNFTELSDEEFHRALYEANNALLQNYFDKKRDSCVSKLKKLYFESDASFRGFRH